MKSESVMKHLNRIKDIELRELIKTSLENCIGEIHRDKLDIIKDFAVAPFEISADQCNATHMVLLTCTYLDSLFVGSIRST